MANAPDLMPPARGLARLFLRKPVSQMRAEHEGSELKRTLGSLNLILLGIGCIIGTGIFVLTGRAAADFAGPGIVISFVMTGTLCAFVALCYAELASMLPVSGSAYSYCYASMGELAAWTMGLLLVLEYGLAAGTVAVGWSGYLVSLLKSLGLEIAPALTAASQRIETSQALVSFASGWTLNTTALPPATMPIALQRMVSVGLVVGVTASSTP